MFRSIMEQMGIEVREVGTVAGDPPDRLLPIVRAPAPAQGQMRVHVLRGSDADYGGIHALQMALHSSLQTSADASSGGAYLLIVEHPPVYTLGRGAALTHFLVPPRFPVYRIFRGGEVTYHGPGQIVLYPIFELQSRALGVRDYVCMLEQLLIDALHNHAGIVARRRDGFPGVWTERGKIASVGIGVKRGIAYHGVALNLRLEPDGFSFINPCGLQVAIDQVANHSGDDDFDRWADWLSELFGERWLAAGNRPVDAGKEICRPRA